MRQAPTKSDESRAANVTEPAGPGDSVLMVLLTLGVAGYVCHVSPWAARAVIFSDCLIGRDEPYFDLYARVPVALMTLLFLARRSSRSRWEIAPLLRVAFLVATAIWGFSLGSARSWW